MNHYIYEITNLINGKKYIGKRSCKCPIEEDKYMGSGTKLKEDFKKYNKENFKKEVLEICKDENEVYKREKYYLDIYDASNDPMYYNIKNSSEGKRAKKKEFTVVCHYPTEENMEAFKRELKRQIEEDNKM